jgi:hypothetical protein
MPDDEKVEVIQDNEGNPIAVRTGNFFMEVLGDEDPKEFGPVTGPDLEVWPMPQDVIDQMPDEGTVVKGPDPEVWNK